MGMGGMGGMRRRRLEEMNMGGSDMVNEDGLTALEVSCGITERLSEQYQGGLKFGVTVGGNRRLQEHGGMVMGCGNTSCLSSQCWIRENEWMHDAMAIELTCDPNVDFVRGMLPHHQSAVDMCRIMYNFVDVQDVDPDGFLEYLCDEIVYHQEEEIEFMVSWLQARDLDIGTRCSSVTTSPSAAPTAAATPMPATASPTTAAPTTAVSTTAAPTSAAPTSAAPTQQTTCSAEPDFDGDGAFRLADAVWMAEVWSGQRTFDHEAPCRDGDYDGDGAFRLADAVWVAELWAGVRDMG
jgi:uncharacterized protein (DUF305 family)